jgi:CRP-like cAMP-binding protein
MVDHAALVDTLIAAVERRAAERDDLHLPAWSRDHWARLLAESTVVELKAGDLLMKREAAGRALYFLIDGSLDVTTARGDSLSLGPIATVLPGSVVGEIAFLDGRERSASVWAREPSRMFRLDSDAFQRLREQEPQLAADLLAAIGEILATRLRAMLGNGR